MVDANTTGLVTTTAQTDYTIWIIICFVILVALGAAIIIFQIRRNRVPKNQIPAEVLAEFNRAEELSRQYKGTITPQEILWKINKDRKNIYTQVQDVPLEMRNDVADEVQQLKVQPQDFQTSVQPKPKINLGGLFRRRT